MHFKHIAIEGNIGSGKTSLAKKLAEHFNSVLILEEFTTNPFLKEFYKTGNGALPMELFFLNARHDQLLNLKKLNQKSPVISDYFLCKSLIFAQNNLSNDEFILYQSLHKKLMDKLDYPDLIIYLNCDIKTLISRIKKRGRIYETKISDNYLSGISDAYLTYFESQKNIKHIIIESDKLNFLENEADFGTVLESILKQ
jgi:deoxyadenosine/deoxycytidine kinase